MYRNYGSLDFWLSFDLYKIVIMAGIDDTVVLDDNGYDQDDIDSGGGAV